MRVALAAAICALACGSAVASASQPYVYEQVTPNVADSVYEGPSHFFVGGFTSDGEHIFVHMGQAMVTEGAKTFDSPYIYRFDHTGDGWTTVIPSLPRPTREETFGAPNFALIGFRDDLSWVGSTSRALDPSDLDMASDLYGVEPDGATAFLSPDLTDPTQGGETVAPTTEAVSEEGRGVVFLWQDVSPLLPGMPTSFLGELYEYNGGLRFVGVDNAGNPLSTGPTRLGGVTLGEEGSAFNAYSTDGSHVFFTAYNENFEQVGLYVRIGGKRTEAIPPLPKGANSSAHFLGATPDGREVFFATEQALDPRDADGTSDLYRYDLETGALTWISHGAAPAYVEDKPVWSSADGSRVYFTADGQLVPGEGTPMGPKTYVYDEGAVHLVADSLLIVSPSQYLINGIAGAPECGPTRMSPDGRYLLAETAASLLPSDRDGGAVDIYRYDAVTQQLAQVSTSAHDPQTAEGAYIQAPTSFGAQGCLSEFAHLTRSIGSDGRFVAFATRAALVPQDVNDREDVYQWDARDGSVSLVSSGLDEEDSRLIDVAPSGEEVLFQTHAAMVASDVDERLDLYVARMGQAPQATVAPAPCRESECQTQDSAVPAFSVPSSTSLAAQAAAGAKDRARLRVFRPAGAALRRLRGTGRLRVSVSPAQDGPVTLIATLREGGGRPVAAGRVSAFGLAGRRLGLTLRLPAAARRLLRSGARLDLLLAVSQAGGSRARTQVVLPRARRRSR